MDSLAEAFRDRPIGVATDLLPALGTGPRARPMTWKEWIQGTDAVIEAANSFAAENCVVAPFIFNPCPLWLRN
eukprot:3338094-Pyramimonas_sp.AAC.1